MLEKYITHFSKAEDCNFIRIMDPKGIAFARAYYYDGQTETFYLDELSVSESCRRQGIGTQLQEIREALAKLKGFKETMLWVEKGTWMEEWYKRRGYKFHSIKINNPNELYHNKLQEIWLIKTL